jgi:cob(I)alamin adenosyltransferase
MAVLLMVGIRQSYAKTTAEAELIKQYEFMHRIFRNARHRIDEADVAESEAWIDEVDAANPPLRTFVMPAGTELAARLHVARTVCRRTERTIISLGSIEPVGEPLLRYMNRLSDLFFAMARRANHERGHPDVPWTPKPVK